jgi:uncharacterized damage-inducible protein DinB
MMMTPTLVQEPISSTPPAPIGCQTCRSSAAAASDGPAWPVAALLRELAQVVGGLDDEQYTRKPVGVIPGSVGGHVRHCLDHATALLRAVRTGTLDYDQRERGTPVECDRDAAQTALRRAALELAAMPGAVVRSKLTVRVLMTADSESVEVGSTFGRELAYVLSHTIHHNAIVGAIVKTLGGELPERFGYAPATIRAAANR